MGLAFLPCLIPSCSLFFLSSGVYPSWQRLFFTHLVLSLSPRFFFLVFFHLSLPSLHLCWVLCVYFVTTPRFLAGQFIFMRGNRSKSINPVPDKWFEDDRKINVKRYRHRLDRSHAADPADGRMREAHSQIRILSRCQSPPVSSSSR